MRSLLRLRVISKSNPKFAVYIKLLALVTVFWNLALA